MGSARVPAYHRAGIAPQHITEARYAPAASIRDSRGNRRRLHASVARKFLNRVDVVLLSAQTRAEPVALRLLADAGPPKHAHTFTPVHPEAGRAICVGQFSSWSIVVYRPRECKDDPPGDRVCPRRKALTFLSCSVSPVRQVSIGVPARRFRAIPMHCVSELQPRS